MESLLPPTGPRVVRLRVVGGHVDLRDDVPKTREDCPKQRPCGHIRCRNHLWLQTGPDRPGRRYDGKGPSSTTLRAVHIEWPLPSSCGADVIERGVAEEWSSAKYAEALGIQESGFWYLLKKALVKLKDHEAVLESLLGPG